MDSSKFVTSFAKKNIFAQFFKQVEYTGVKQNKDKQDFHSNILSLQGFLKCSSSALWNITTVH